jgi:hypothetical protein
MKVAVIGSRSFNDYSILEKELNFLNETIGIDTIVSGGAAGADSLAEQYADSLKIPTQIFMPNWKLHGKSAGVIRNQSIIANSEYCIAFWDGKSKGTLSSIRFAEKEGIPVKIINF